MAAPLRFEEVYDAHVDWIWRNLASWGFRGAALEDTVQDVFLIVHRRLESFEGRSKIESWLYSIVRHVALNHRRRFRRKEDLELLPESLRSSGPTPEEQAENGEALSAVEQFLASLRDEQREVFALIEIEGFSAPEVADMLSVKVNTVYSRLRLARRAFDVAIAEGQEEEP